MNKQKADESNTTQGTGSKQTADTPKTKSGKDAESHTKAGKGAGGGAKQGQGDCMKDHLGKPNTLAK